MQRIPCMQCLICMSLRDVCGTVQWVSYWCVAGLMPRSWPSNTVLEEGNYAFKVFFLGTPTV